MKHVIDITPRKATIWLLAIFAFCVIGTTNRAAETFDVVVYGGTSAGVIAAVQARLLGKSVVLIEPTRHLGGLSSGGLGQTDIGNKRAIGGAARNFYERVAQYYSTSSAWVQQKPETYRGSGNYGLEAGEAAGWTFEPHVAEKIFNDLIREAGVNVILGERLDLKNGVRKVGPRITVLGTESGRLFAGRMFIDATYEGDLMAKAGVAYTIGREANKVYDETLNGIQAKRSITHNLVPGVDPYIRRGDASSGLLPGIDPDGPGNEGDGDRRIQAYCFRMCLTDVPENQISFAKPADYKADEYELLLRNFEAGETTIPWINSPIPNRKTDTNNRTGVSTDYIGQNYDYPEGDYATRAKIAKAHQRYQAGLMWTLVHSPRVPKAISNEVGRWGLAKDEFTENGGWPEQLYVREARRMTSAYVMTQKNCEGRETASDSIGLAAYTMDSHQTQRYIDEKGYVRNEGCIEQKGFPPYPISYRSIVPKQQECENLFVPICLSASHIAYGSIRMEPVFMVLGQSAAFAASLAIDRKIAAQEVDYISLRKALLSAGQIIEWKKP